MKYFLCFLFAITAFKSNAQLVKDSVLIGTHYRTFFYNQPVTSFRNGSLMFIMHGSGGNAMDIVAKSKLLESMAPQENLLVVYPEGYKHYWNECRKYATSEANKENIDEASFFRSMIKFFVTKFAVTKDRIFAAGFSGGGQMAYKLGLVMPGEINAITAVVANLPVPESCDCSMSNKALPVMIINGTDDPVNPDKGGEMFVGGSSFGVVRSTEGSFKYWSDLAGYKDDLPLMTSLPDNDIHDNKTITKYSFSEAGKPTVALLSVKGGKHDYPGDIDVYVYAWNFFKSTFGAAIMSDKKTTQPTGVKKGSLKEKNIKQWREKNKQQLAADSSAVQ